MRCVHQTHWYVAQAGTAPCAERLVERTGRRSRRSREVGPHLVSSHRFGGEQRTVEHEMWAVLDQRLVFRRQRLSLGGVDHNDRTLPGRGACRAAPLARGGKPGAPAAAEAATLEYVEHPLAAARPPPETLPVLVELLRARCKRSPGKQPGSGAVCRGQQRIESRR